MKALSACVLVALAAALAAGVEPGRACSCALPDPREALARADGAFVGKLVSRRQSDQQAVLTFSVERTLKGAIGATVEVATASSGAACGIEAPTGTRLGLVLERRGGAWHGYLCWQFEPAELLAAATPLPPPTGRGPVALVLGAELGDMRLLALDSEGRTLAYGRGGGRTALVSVCPGGQRLTEIVASASRTMLVVRDARTLRRVRRQLVRLPSFQYPQRLRCQDRAASSAILFVRGGRDSVSRAALHRLDQRARRTLWKGTAHDAALGATAAFLSAGRRGRQLLRVDLSTAGARILAEAPGALTALSVDDRMTRIAGLRTRSDGSASQVVLVQLAGRQPVVRSARLGDQHGQLFWLPRQRLLYLPAWGTGPARILDAGLRTRSRFRWNAASGAVVEDAVFGIDQTWTLSRAALPAGPQRRLRRLPGRASLIVGAR